jgi:glutathione peroxidase-family protein
MKLTYKDWSLEYVIEWETLFVLSIFVEERRQWTATQLMNMLLEKAREEEVNVIELPAMSFDPEEWMETEELKDRCERMWFETVEKYSIWENKWYAMRMEL